MEQICAVTECCHMSNRANSTNGRNGSSVLRFREIKLKTNVHTGIAVVRTSQTRMTACLQDQVLRLSCMHKAPVARARVLKEQGAMLSQENDSITTLSSSCVI